MIQLNNFSETFDWKYTYFFSFSSLCFATYSWCDPCGIIWHWIWCFVFNFGNLLFTYVTSSHSLNLWRVYMQCYVNCLLQRNTVFHMCKWINIMFPKTRSYRIQLVLDLGHSYPHSSSLLCPPDCMVDHWDGFITLRMGHGGHGFDHVKSFALFTESQNF